MRLIPVFALLVPILSAAPPQHGIGRHQAIYLEVVGKVARFDCSEEEGPVVAIVDFRNDDRTSSSQGELIVALG